MKPYTIYLKDLFIKLFYSTLSYVLCCLILFWYIDIFFLFETYPFLLEFTNKRFILTQLTQLFNVVQYYIFFLSLIYFSPFFLWHIFTFFISTWYVYQIKLFRICLIFLIIFLIIFVFTHIFLLPKVISFFLSWEFLTFNAIVRIEPEVTFDSYIIWILSFKTIFSFFVAFILILLITFYNFLKANSILTFLFYYKRVLIFSITLTFFVLIPPDLSIQFFLIFIFIFTYEIFLLFICIKTYFFYKYSIILLQKCPQLDNYLKNPGNHQILQQKTKY
uniref:Sec-independent protein translocase protein n=1 Tax=Calliarthron tuberculosum TaxID=48942 RepID=A0A0F6Y5U0_CALTB|nr:Sec-independent protein translocase protein [Calliarthron tuberculosum]AKG26252.1 Sec-independent protein translocase protein [Calliarthron tuberculosum]